MKALHTFLCVLLLLLNFHGNHLTSAQVIFTSIQNSINLSFPSIYLTYGLRDEWQRLPASGDAFLVQLSRSGCNVVISHGNSSSSRGKIAVISSTGFSTAGCPLTAISDSLESEGFDGFLFCTDAPLLSNYERIPFSKVGNWLPAAYVLPDGAGAELCTILAQDSGNLTFGTDFYVPYQNIEIGKAITCLICATFFLFLSLFKLWSTFPSDMHSFVTNFFRMTSLSGEVFLFGAIAAMCILIQHATNSDMYPYHISEIDFFNYVTTYLALGFELALFTRTLFSWVEVVASIQPNIIVLKIKYPAFTLVILTIFVIIVLIVVFEFYPNESINLAGNALIGLVSFLESLLFLVYGIKLLHILKKSSFATSSSEAKKKVLHSAIACSSVFMAALIIDFLDIFFDGVALEAVYILADLLAIFAGILLVSLFTSRSTESRTTSSRSQNDKEIEIGKAMIV